MSISTFFLIILITLISNIQSKSNILKFPLIQIYGPDDYNYINSLLQSDVYTTINIGTPAQNMRIYIFQSLFMTYFAGEKSQAKIESVSFFDSTKSNTYRTNETKEFKYVHTDFVFAYNAYDNLQNIVNNFSFLLITKFEERMVDLYPAKMGLKGSATEEEKKEFLKHNFIHQLLEKKVISKNIYTINFDNETNGNLIFGAYPDEYDNSYNNKDLISIPGLNNEEWSINFNTISLNGIELDSIKKGSFLIEYGLIKAPKEYVELFTKHFFQKYIDEKICKYHITSPIHFSCNSKFNINDFKGINFTLNAYNFSFFLDSNSLFHTYKNITYFYIVFGNGNWIFGKPFFEKYQLSFDLDKGSILWYGKKMKNKTNISIIFIIIFGIIIISIGGYYAYYFYIKNAKRKKRALELDEEFIYDPTEKINTDFGNLK